MSCIWTGYFYNLALFWSPAWHVCRRQLSIMPTRKAFIEWVMTSITVRHFCSVLSAFFPTHTKLPNYSIPKPFPSDLIGQLDLYLWAESITSHHPFSPLAMNYLVLSSSPGLLNSTSRYNDSHYCQNARCQRMGLAGSLLLLHKIFTNSINFYYSIILLNLSILLIKLSITL